MSTEKSTAPKYQQSISRKGFTGWNPDGQDYDNRVPLDLKTGVDPELGADVAVWFDKAGNYVGWSSFYYVDKVRKALKNDDTYEVQRARWNGWYLGEKTDKQGRQYLGDNKYYIIPMTITAERLSRYVSTATVVAIISVDDMLTTKEPYSPFGVNWLPLATKEMMSDELETAYNAAKKAFEGEWLLKVKAELEAKLDAQRGEK